MFSCEFCELFKNTFFTEHLQATASVGSKNNSFKTKQWSHQEMLYEIRDLPISDNIRDISYEITWKFTKILGTSQWRSFFQAKLQAYSLKFYNLQILEFYS